MGSGRASKKTKLIVDDQELPSSSLDAVVSNDDLLIEIILRLPTCSLLQFKSVSKRWLSLITSPVSTTLLCSKKPNVEPLSGLFLQRFIHPPVIYDYVPFDIGFQVNRFPPVNTDFRFDFPNEGNVEILQSCNGLLLCRPIDPDTHYKYNPFDTQHYVYNPSTNQFKNFPPLCKYSGVESNGGMRLAYDPIKSPYYKLVFAEEKRDYDRGYDYVQIQTYSSETGTWSICPDQFPNSKFSSFCSAIYWNNGLHWIHNENKHLKLDVENLVLTTIQTHDALLSFKLFESRGCLLLVGRCTNHTDDRTRCLGIYEMSKGYCKWSMKCLVNLDKDINMKLFPLRAELRPAILIGCYKVLCIVLAEKEEDSFLMLETCGKVVQYKIVLETVRELYNWGTFHPEVRAVTATAISIMHLLLVYDPSFCFKYDLSFFVLS